MAWSAFAGSKFGDKKSKASSSSIYEDNLSKPLIKLLNKNLKSALKICKFFYFPSSGSAQYAAIIIIIINILNIIVLI